MADSDFKVYSTPLPTERFSKHFFQNINIGHLVELRDYPTIAAESSLQTWQWSKHVPHSNIGVSVIPNEVIPNACDLARAYSGMERAWNRGARSALVMFHHEGLEYKYIYSFVKLKLIKLVNEYAGPRQELIKLLEYLGAPLVEQLGFRPVVDKFRRCLFLEGLSGFAITRCPLYKLPCLLGENWIDQDVLDALIEKHYFESYAKSVPGADPAVLPPTNLILSTDFVTDAEQIYQSNGLAGLDAFPAGRNLRRRIESTTISSISVCRIQSDHYTALTFGVGAGALKYADSMHGEVPHGLGRLISRVLSTPSVPVPSRFERGIIALQGGTNGGEGSCGIASLNFIQQASDMDTQPWTGPQSQQFRLIALLDLVRYHCIARDLLQAGETFSTHWAYPASPEVAQALEHPCSAPASQYTGSGYCDFNLYTPTMQHPIFSFLNQGPALVVQDYAVVRDSRQGLARAPPRTPPVALSIPREVSLSATPVPPLVYIACESSRAQRGQPGASSVNLFPTCTRLPPGRCRERHAERASPAVYVPSNGSVVVTSPPHADSRPPLRIFSYFY